MTHDGDYHGQEFVADQEPSEAPGQPAEADAIDALGHAPLGGPIAEFSRVVISGSYGAFCAQKQVLEYFDITLAQARRRKWDYFGVCGSTMTCYDSDNNPVHEE